MIRLLFLHAQLLHGGEDRLVQTVHNGLDRGRFLPSVATLYGPGPVGEQMIEQGAEFYQRLGPNRFSLWTYFNLRELIMRLQTDVLYVTDSPLPLFWAGIMKRTGHLKRLIVGYHSMGQHERLGRYFVSKRVALPVADRFVALSETHRGYLSRHERITPDRFAVIPVGIDTHRFTPAVDKPADKERLGFASYLQLVGIVGALRKEKNHEFFIDMAVLLKKRLPNARFVIVGDGDRRETLQRIAKDRGVAGTVVFLGPRNDVDKVVRAFDVLVLTSRPVVETFPQVLLEGMASGIPVCTTDVGSVRDILQTDVHGAISPAGQPEMMAENVEHLLNNTELCAEMGEAGRERVEKLFTKQLMIDRYEALFEAVVYIEGLAPIPP
jgi:glycosyltransferase involved in cell wall biosynthesis